ncbi:MAG: ABC transporter ATP-binding protein [Sandaracinaceae bacterium]
MAGELSARAVSVQRGARTVLSSVDFDASPASVTAILGPNGAGKSTLLKALAGVLAFDGQVTLDGAPLAAMSARERAHRVSYVPQQTRLSVGLDVAAVVAQGRYAHTGGLSRRSGADRAALASAMRRTDVEALASRRFDRLSAGEQRRVLVARALATEARVVLLDEPTAALDVRQALSLHALLRELAADGYTVVVVLHELDAARSTDRAVMLVEGRVEAAGPSEEVVSAARIERVYGVALVEGGALGFRLPERGS